MSRTVKSITLIFAALVLLSAQTLAQRPTLTTLYDFGQYPNDGLEPSVPVTVADDGTLYGVTPDGGDAYGGTVYSLSPPASPGGPWVETVLFGFPSGTAADPDGSLLIGKGPGQSFALYGTTFSGGASGGGVVYSLTPPAPAGEPWTYTSLHDFSFSPGQPIYGVTAGRSPAGQLALFGATANSGASTDNLYMLTAPNTPGGSWTLHVIHDFTGEDGQFPSSGLLIDNNGVLYGTTRGGEFNVGTVYSLTPPANPGGEWTETILYTFNIVEGTTTDGGNPCALAFGSQGELYGVTQFGPGSNYGSVFSLTPPETVGGAWTYTLLYTFTGGSNDGKTPDSLVRNPISGALYGSTMGDQFHPIQQVGTIFVLEPPAIAGGPWTERLLYTFHATDGARPTGVVLGGAGLLYGTTSRGGSLNQGIVFSLSPNAGTSE